MSFKRPSSAGANRKKPHEKYEVTQYDHKPQPRVPDDLFDFDSYFTDDSMWGYKQIVQVSIAIIIYILIFASKLMANTNRK
jgi:hypothetical protein